MSTARTKLSRLSLTVVMVGAVALGSAGPARAATVTSIVFNNVSTSPDLNTDPTSWAQEDDLSVAVGGTLYLPTSAKPDQLTGWLVDSGGGHTAFGAGDYDLTAGSVTGDYTLNLDGVSGSIAVHQSAEIPAMYITTGQGLEWIEASKDNEDENATMALVEADASTTYNDDLSEMKGRGNTTWQQEKKPYQIKLDSKTELVPDSGAPNKTWILLANYLDASLIRNELAYNMEGDVLNRASAPDFAIDGEMIDLFIDGGFRGSYYLTEKVQVNDDRVDVTNLDDANEDANPGVDLGAISPTKVSSLSGAPGIQEASYVDFASPADYDKGGYLLEMDFASSARDETSYVITKNGTPFVLKSPDPGNLDEVTYIGNRLQKIEDAIYSPNGKNSDGDDYSDLMDLDSIARYYVMQEILANDDGFKSSTYFWLDQGGKLMSGPLWDFDRAAGSLVSGADADSGIYVAKPTRLKPRWIYELMSHDSFREAVKAQYRTIVGPEMQEILRSGGKLDAYAAEVERSAVLNKLRWGNNDISVVFPTPAEDVDLLRTYLTERNVSLAGIFGDAGFAEASMLPEGYFTIANRALTLDISSSSLLSRANAQVWKPNGTGAQTFRVERGDDAFYAIRNVNSTKVLDVRSSIAESGTNVWQHSANGTRAQQWRITTFDGGKSYTISSALGIEAILDTSGSGTGYVLDVAHSGTTPGTNVQIWTPNGSSAQQFGFNSVTLADPPGVGSTYAIASRLDQNKVVDVAHSSGDSGANIWLWRSNGTSAQRFTVEDAGSGRVKLVTGTGTDAVVDVKHSGTASGTNVWQWRDNGSDAQRWTLRPTGDLNGSYYVVAESSGLYLDVARSGTDNGTNIQIWTGNASKAQKFFFTKL